MITTTTTLSSSANPATYNDSVSFSASVTGSSSGGNISGTVTFFVGGTAIGTGAVTGALNLGAASITLTNLLAGSSAITASYSGDSNYSPSAASALTQTVTKQTPVSNTVTSAPYPSVYGQPVTITAALTYAGSPSTILPPTGTMTFYHGTSPIGTAAVLQNGIGGTEAVLTVDNLPVGTPSLGAEYGGDNNFNSLSATPITQTVSKADTTTTLSTANNFNFRPTDKKTQAQDSLGGELTRIFDALNRAISLRFGGTDQTPLREDITYTPRDQVATQTRYSNLSGTTLVGTSNMNYDVVGRPTQIRHKDGSGNNIANYQNAFDLANKITAEVLNNSAATNYLYDTANQLTKDSANSYTYDDNGNRTMPGYETGPNNQILTDGTWNYYADKNGNIITKINISDDELWNYSFDNRNRLNGAKQTTSDGVQMEAAYAYDALGQRTEKIVTTGEGTTTTRYAYDETRQIWADLDGENALLMRYIRGQRILEIIARSDAEGTAAWLLTDQLGSVRNIVDGSGAEIDSIDYDGYGNIIGEISPANGGEYKYASYRWDEETGLLRPDSTWGRLYGPSIGRWWSVDPIGILGGDANWWRYCLNNPMNIIDPSGLQLAPPTAYYALAGTGPVGWVAIGVIVGWQLRPAISSLFSSSSTSLGSEINSLVAAAMAAAQASKGGGSIAPVPWEDPNPKPDPFRDPRLPKGPPEPRPKDKDRDPCEGLTIITFSLTGKARHIAFHIMIAQKTKGKGPFTHDTNEAHQRRRRRIACPGERGGCPRTALEKELGYTSCDEYPFASSTDGGLDASTMCVPHEEQCSQGGTIHAAHLHNGQKYCVEVVP